LTGTPLAGARIPLSTVLAILYLYYKLGLSYRGGRFALSFILSHVHSSMGLPSIQPQILLNHPSMTLSSRFSGVSSSLNPLGLSFRIPSKPLGS